MALTFGSPPADSDLLRTSEKFILRRTAMYNILVVDDESRIRTIIRKYAEFEGHKVTEAGDGMEAVLRCREGGYDIVIMDIMMPELDGFSACREIR